MDSSFLTPKTGEIPIGSPIRGRQIQIGQVKIAFFSTDLDLSGFDAVLPNICVRPPLARGSDSALDVARNITCWLCDR